MTSGVSTKLPGFLDSDLIALSTAGASDWTNVNCFDSAGADLATKYANCAATFTLLRGLWFGTQFTAANLATYGLTNVPLALYNYNAAVSQATAFADLAEAFGGSDAVWGDTVELENFQAVLCGDDGAVGSAADIVTSLAETAVSIGTENFDIESIEGLMSELELTVGDEFTAGTTVSDASWDWLFSICPGDGSGLDALAEQWFDLILALGDPAGTAETRLPRDADCDLNWTASEGVTENPSPCSACPTETDESGAIV